MQIKFKHDAKSDTKQSDSGTKMLKKSESVEKLKSNQLKMPTVTSPRKKKKKKNTEEKKPVYYAPRLAINTFNSEYEVVS